MKTFVWILIFLGLVFLGLCFLSFFNVPSRPNVYIALGALAGVLTNWTLKRIKREP